MDLRAVLARRAVTAAHVLVVEVPGSWRARVAVEQEVARRRWQRAASPADADVLAVCGEPGGRLAGAVERVWEQVPGPRARVAVPLAGAAAAALDEAARLLLDDPAQRREARERTAGAAREPQGEEAADHGDRDHGDRDHGDMDHDDMDMAPAGIPLASGADDRDGLEMDVLTVPLGPVLPAWPAGLVLTVTLAGDVVTGAEVEVLDAADPQAPPGAVPDDARALDAASALLTLAGWDAAAAAAARARDLALAGDPAAGRERDRLRHRVARSRLLRWSLAGLGALDVAALDRADLPASLTGDVRDRLLRLLDAEPPPPVPAGPALAALPDLVTGLDLAASRLVVASLALDTGVREPAAARGGGAS